MCDHISQLIATVYKYNCEDLILVTQAFAFSTNVNELPPPPRKQVASKKLWGNPNSFQPPW